MLMGPESRGLWTWTKTFTGIEGASWVDLHGYFATVIEISAEVIVRFLTKPVSAFTWHLSEGTFQSVSPAPEQKEYSCILLQPRLLDHRNGDGTHTPRSRSWRRSSKWSGLCENRWLHGSYNPESFQMRLHLRVQKGKGGQRDTSAGSISRSSKEKAQRIWIVTLGTT